MEHESSIEIEPQETIRPGSVELDTSRQQRAREYASTGRRLFFAEIGGILVLVVLLLATGASAALRNRATTILPNPWWVVAFYAVVLGTAYTLLSFPLDFYSSYLLPHKYGTSTQSLDGWIRDKVKGLALTALIGLLGLELLYWLLRTFPTWWWTIMALLVWLFATAAAQLAPILLMPIFYKVTPLQDSELLARIDILTERAGTRVRGVYVMDMSSKTTAANAMLTGLGPTRRIILGDTLLAGYTHDEIETVLAHEIAHHVHNDLPKGLAAEGAFMLLGMWVASLVLGWGVGIFHLRGVADVAALPLFGLAMMAFGLVAMPPGNYLTRQMERAADRYALTTTGKWEAFRSVMLKLANQNLADADPPAWVKILFGSHPPLLERVKAAEEFGSTAG
ncbi:MAG: M48 family metallopeptidase [Chloroflexota bacterium]|nr:M48 family metallopeptidase [Chloroflexota bacterium]